jgi:hypothetical protein
MHTLRCDLAERFVKIDRWHGVSRQEILGVREAVLWLCDLTVLADHWSVLRVCSPAAKSGQYTCDKSETQ